MAAVFVSMSFIWTDLPELSQEVRDYFISRIGTCSVAPTTEVGKQLPPPVSLGPKGLSKLGCGLADGGGGGGGGVCSECWVVGGSEEVVRTLLFDGLSYSTSNGERKS